MRSIKKVKHMEKASSFPKMVIYTEVIFVKTVQKDFVSSSTIVLYNFSLEHVSYQNGLIAIGEMKNAEWHGKRTAYFEEGEVEN